MDIDNAEDDTMCQTLLPSTTAVNTTTTGGLLQQNDSTSSFDLSIMVHPVSLKLKRISNPFRRKILFLHSLVFLLFLFAFPISVNMYRDV